MKPLTHRLRLPSESPFRISFPEAVILAVLLTVIAVLLLAKLATDRTAQQDINRREMTANGWEPSEWTTPGGVPKAIPIRRALLPTE